MSKTLTICKYISALKPEKAKFTRHTHGWQDLDPDATNSLYPYVTDNHDCDVQFCTKFYKWPEIIDNNWGYSQYNMLATKVLSINTSGLFLTPPPC